VVNVIPASGSAKRAPQHFSFFQALTWRLMTWAGDSPLHHFEYSVSLANFEGFPDVMLKNKLVVVTGASRGIGRAIAERYAEEGATLFITARSVDKLQEVSPHITPDQPAD
jgi:3-oxoacyl-ACP reductase-like protein